MFVATNTSFVVTKVCLLQQIYFCHDKHNFVVTIFLSWQTHVCHDKTHCFLRQKYACYNKTFVVENKCWPNNFIVTKVLSWQAYFCHNKRCVLSWQTCVCCDKQEFVMTKLLSWHKWYLWQFPPMIAQGAFQCKHQQRKLTHVQTNLQTQLWERQVKKSYWTGESGGWFWKRKKVQSSEVLEANCFKQIEWRNSFTAVLWLI